jgi:acyl carrier protein
VIHAAGVSHDLPIEALETDDIHPVMRPKVLGAHNLHELTLDDPIELFLLISSVSATTGTSGQAAYAAANAGLETFAHWRRRHGLPAIAAGLGPVADVGMAALTEAIIRYVELLGFTPLPTDQLAAIFDRAISWNRPVIGAYDIDWQTWAHAEPAAASAPRFSAILAAAATGSEADGHLARLRALPEDQRIDAIAELVIDALTAVLGMEQGAIEPDTPLDTLGLDSLMLLELQTHLNRTIGAELTLMNLLGLATTAEIAAAIARSI